MKYTLPTIAELHSITESEEKTIDHLRRMGVIPSERTCRKCGNCAKLTINRKTFRCTRFDCRAERSYLAETFFSGHNIKPNQILEFAYYWLSKATNKQIETYLGLANKTVTAFTQYLQELVGDSLDEVDLVVGGPDIEVEIDETKLGKRKYHKGHRVDGVWVLVGVERTPERKVFLRILEDRTALTLTSMIQRHVAPGSKIITDCWRGYGSLESHGYHHTTGNHSQTFLDPITGACTNTVEGTNNALKMSLQPRKRTKQCEDCLWEFVWRRKNESMLWDAFHLALKEVIYD